MKRFLTLLAVLVAAAAPASNFVYDNLPTPSNKTQRRPVVNPSQELSATEFNQVTGALRDIRTAINDNTTVFNVKRYGAVCDGVNDDTAAIQGALDAAKAYQLSTASRPQVALPQGVCKQSKPLFVPPAITFAGLSKASTLLSPVSGFYGYNLIAAQDASTGYGPYAQGAFATPGQYTMTSAGSFDPANHYFDLAQTERGRLPTNASWTVSFRFKPTDVSGIQVVHDIGGQMWPNQYNSALSIDWHPGSPGTFYVLMRYNGQGVSTIATWGTPISFTNGTEHHFEVSYDQSTHSARFFFDGQLWTNGTSGRVDITTGGVTTHPADGSGMMEYPWEAHTIGPNGPSSSVSIGAAKVYGFGTMRQFHFSDGVRHTATFTPASTVTADGSTRLLLNFDQFYKGMLVADVGISGKAYLYPWIGQVDEVPGVVIRNLFFFGGSGILAEFASQMLIEDVIHLNASDGWRFGHNGYFSRFRNLDLIGGVGRSALHIDAGSYNTIDSCTIAGPIGLSLNSANVFGSANSISVQSGYFAGLVVVGAGGITDLTGLAIDAEVNTTVPWLGAVVIGGSGSNSFTLRTPTLYNPPNKTADPIILVENADDTHPTRILLESPYFAVTPSSAPVLLNWLSFIAGTTYWSHPAVFVNPVYPAGTPFAVTSTIDYLGNATATPGNVLDTSAALEQMNARSCTAAPVAGHWTKGNICWNSNAGPGDYVGFINTTTGSPGTWKGFGAIAP